MSICSGNASHSLAWLHQNVRVPDGSLLALFCVEWFAVPLRQCVQRSQTGPQTGLYLINKLLGGHLDRFIVAAQSCTVHPAYQSALPTVQYSTVQRDDLRLGAIKVVAEHEPDRSVAEGIAQLCLFHAGLATRGHSI